MWWKKFGDTINWYERSYFTCFTLFGLFGTKETIMSVDIDRTIEILKDALLRDLGDEVDLIFRYGSFLKGATR